MDGLIRYGDGESMIVKVVGMYFNGVSEVVAVGTEKQ